MIRVMVVDDMDIARVLITQACTRIGVEEVITAKNGSDAWAQLQALTEVDAIISDYMMPGLTGEKLLEKVRADKNHKDVPFILVTSDSEREKMSRLKEMGASGYIVKPFSVDSLEKDLRNILASKIAGIKGD